MATENRYRIDREEDMAHTKSVRSLYSREWRKKTDRIPHPLLNPNTRNIDFEEKHTMVTFDIEGKIFNY